MYQYLKSLQISEDTGTYQQMAHNPCRYGRVADRIGYLPVSPPHTIGDSARKGEKYQNHKRCEKKLNVESKTILLGSITMAQPRGENISFQYLLSCKPLIRCYE